MKKRNGFTLIELLAVVVILALIALVILPTISGLTKQTRMKAFENTAYGLVKVGQQYFSENKIIDGKFKEQTFNFPKDVDKLDFNGEVPKSGTMTIDKDGKIELAISNGRYCATKAYNETKVTVTEDLEQCGIVIEDDNEQDDNGTINEKTLSQLATTSKELGVTSVHACATSGTCELGTAFAIKVNNRDTFKFYVIGDDGNTLTLIMSENLERSAWMNKDDYVTENNKEGVPEACGYTACNDEGPITAANYLDNLTNEAWSNIPLRDYIYSGIDDEGNKKYEDITRTMRARMITYLEVNAIVTANNGTFPSYINGSALGAAYWTSTADASRADYACFVGNYGGVYGGEVYRDFGLRPVIELSK